MAGSEQHAALRTNVYGGFDLVRLCAALGVVLSHGYATVGRIEDDLIWRFFPGLFTVSSISVGCFFSVSGYLVTRSFLARATNAHGVLDFIAARCLRIFPAFVVCLAIAVFVGATVTTLPFDRYWSSPETWEYVYRNLTLRWTNELPGVFSSNINGPGVNGSTWTVPLEMGMYSATLLFGLAGAWLAAWRAATVAALLIVWSYFAPQYFVFFAEESGAAAYSVLCYAIGTLWAVWRVDQRSTRIVALIIAAAFVLTYALGETLTLARLIAFALVAVLALYVARMQHSWMSSASRFGDLSYGVFLYSSLIQQTLVWANPSMGLAALLVFSTVISLIAASISWHLIEKRALSLKPSAEQGANRGAVTHLLVKAWNRVGQKP